MKVAVAPEAAAQILFRKRWWRKNRSKAPERFDEELAEALKQIGERPESFLVFSERNGRIVRRYLLDKTRCHLYFEIVPSVGEVLILAARGAVRRPRRPSNL
jgi:plasmid stabilization system protein ParE